MDEMPVLFPKKIRAILDKMLAADPTARFLEPREVANALESFFGNSRMRNNHWGKTLAAIAVSFAAFLGIFFGILLLSKPRLPLEAPPDITQYEFHKGNTPPEDEPGEQIPIPDGNGSSAFAFLLSQFSKAVATIDDNQPLWNFIVQFELSTESELMTREALFLRLSGLENLIDRVKNTDPEALATALQSLDRVLLDHHLGNRYPDAHLYADLYRFFDQAIRVCAPAKHHQLVQYLLFRQGPDPSGRLRSLSQDSTFVAFYFSPWSEEVHGFALYYPVERQKARRFELPFNRAEIKNASQKGEELAWDETLVSLIRQDSESGVPIVLSWDDTACWSLAQDAITIDDWPFGESIAIEEIMGQMK
jgi:hypothetical protein